MATNPPPPDRFAIIGIGCRMPPNANSLSTFWRFLMRGGNALKPIKTDRWDWRQYWDADPQRPGKTYQAKGGFLDADIKQFDPLAFGISPREAASLDPQQRLLLETAWEAFDDAGIPLARISGSATGVFVGGFCLDHLLFQAQPSNRHLINAHAAGGVMMTVLSNRLSHAFNLRGPSITLDTACSSSLVALHYACQSLRLRECDMVLAGGVNVMTRPEFPIIMSKGHFLSDHGECHAFDETAAGYARGEGAGLLLLKRCDEAVADGDLIHAVVRATGVNQDGHTDGISLPNSQAQEELIGRVYREAGLPLAEVDYVEAHGTGTQAGDAAELGALHRSFAAGRKNKLMVGSVKTNIGHLEAAAGVAGLLKVIGVLKNRQIPKNLHFKNPNPRIPFAEYCVEVAAEGKMLPGREEKPVIFAGINSFGYGGTNAHALLESAPDVLPASPGGEGVRIVPFSARNEKALRDLAGKMAFQLGQEAGVSLDDLAYSCAKRRNHLEFRAAAIAENINELREQLIAVSTGQAHEGACVGASPVEAGAGLVFVYTGMGPQWWGMGQELIRSEPVVAETLAEIDRLFRPLSGWSLREAMLAKEGESRIHHTDLAQPANFALQVALTRLWEASGIRPAAVIGHSVGEVTAAYVAGVYRLEEAVQVSFHRSRLQQTMAGQGAMLATGLSESDAEALIEDFPKVSVAAVNSFSAVTLSGDAAELKQIAAGLEERGVFQKFLRVEVAYHSPQMDPLRDELLAALADLSPQPARLPLFSTAFGKIVPGRDWNAEYWWENVRHPVHFAAAARELLVAGYQDFLEIGPHPVLGNSLKECALHLSKPIRCFTSLRRAEPERPRLTLTLAELYCAGHDPDWNRLAPPHGRLIAAPQYPWQRQLCWNESERSRMERLGLPGPVYLNRTLPGPDACWEVEINRNYFPFLFDHIVQDQIVFAGMGYIEAALALSARVHETPGVVLENVRFERVLVVDYAKLQYLLTTYDPQAGRFRILSRTEGGEDSAQAHCTGRMFPKPADPAEHLDLKTLTGRCPSGVGSAAFYARLRRQDLNYGPAFRPVVEMNVGEKCFLVKIDCSAVVGGEEHPLHPVIFDAALQAVIFCTGQDRLFVPFSFGEFVYSRPVATPECYAYGEFIRQTGTQVVAHVWLLDANGRVCVRAREIALQFVDTKAGLARDELLYALDWKPSAGENFLPANADGILILADAADSDLPLAQDLAAGLPGAALEIREGGADGGFGAAEMTTLLGKHSTRNRVVVLWGSREFSGDPGALSEKAIGLLQCLGVRRSEVIFVTRGAVSVAGEKPANPLAHPLSALGLVAQNEFEALTCRSVDLPFEGDENDARNLLAELSPNASGDVAYRNGERFVGVLNLLQEEAAEEWDMAELTEPLEFRQRVKGRWDALGFERTERVAPGTGEVELRVLRAGLNGRDFLKIEGRTSPLAPEETFWGSSLGMECAGVVERVGEGSRLVPGDLVVAILPRAFRTYVTVPDTFVFPSPSALELAGSPVSYLTAWRGLMDLAHLQKGERVLIHRAADDLGLAAISIAKWVGAEIFATAENDEKRRALEELGGCQVFDCGNPDFGRQIKTLTHHEGIDVVLGVLPGQAMRSSLSLLRTGGRYIEVGNADIPEDGDLPLRAFSKNIGFLSLDIDRLAQERPQLIRETLTKILAHFEAGDFAQSHVRIIPAAGLPAAFAATSNGSPLGKIVADFSSGQVPLRRTRNGRPLVHKDGCYLVTGGTSGFGLTTARWLAAQGAGKILLVSRSGARAPGIEETLREMETLGAQVEVVSADVTNPAQVHALAARTGDFVLRGIVHGAMVLDDVPMTELTEERFRRVFAPKVLGALNLAALAAKSPALDFLVFHSSISALVGNIGQTNYIAANSALDALARKMRAEGLPATSINWGALAESGIVARDERLGSALAAAGVTGLTNEQALTALDHAIRLGRPNVGAFLVDWKRWGEANPKLAGHPRFRDLLLLHQTADANDPAARLRQSLAGLGDEPRLGAVLGHLQEVVASTLRMPKEAISETRKLNEMGVDSLLVLELSLGIRERLGIGFSAMEFLKGPSLRELAAMAVQKLWPDEG